MADCDNIPTLKTVQDFNKDVKVLTEVVTSDEDVSPSKASDGENKITLSGIEKIALGKARESAPVSFVDGVFEYEFPGFNASLSSFIVRSPNGVFPTQPLTRVVNGVGDYDYADITTQTITLTSSWSGGEIIARSLDPTGTGVIQSPISFTRAELVAAIGLADGDYVIDTENGNAPFIINPVGYVPSTGDVPMDSGQVAVLQTDSDGDYNVEWFLAKGTNGAVDQYQYFEDAAQRSTEDGAGGQGPWIKVNNGQWRVDSPVTVAVCWDLAAKANIIGIGQVAPSGDYDTSNLTGTVKKRSGAAQFKSIQYGDPAYTVQKYTGKAFPGVVTAFGLEAGGLTGTAHTSAYSALDSGAIGARGILLVDDTTGRGGWALYSEAHRAPGAVGNGFCGEHTVFNRGSTGADTPYQPVAGRTNLSYNQWLTTGGSATDFPDCNDSTAAIGILGKGGAKYNKGIIFKKKSVTSEIAIAMPSSYQLAWYAENTGGTEVRSAYTRATMPVDSGQYNISVYDDALAGYRAYNYSPISFFPGTNNILDIATAGLRFKTIYLVNSPDVSSDESLKLKRSDENLAVDGELNQAEVDAALAIARLPRMFQWLSEIEEKQGDSEQTVYLHCSPMAQEVWAAFENEGLDPSLYGFINDGDDYGAKWSLQPQELLWMICAAQQSKIDDFESRLAALEDLNG